MVTTHQLTNQRVKAIRKVVLEDSNTMKDILDPSSVGFRPHQVLLLSISYATSTVLVLEVVNFESAHLRQLNLDVWYSSTGTGSLESMTKLPILRA